MTVSPTKLLNKIKKLEKRSASPDFRKGIQRARSTPLLQVAQQVFPDFEVYDHHYAIARALELLFEYFETKGESGHQKVTLSIPRRHTKSLLGKIGSYAFQARNPNESIIYTSYGSTLSHTHSKEVRDWTVSPATEQLYPQMTLNQQRKAIEHWELRYFRGQFIADGIRGGLTGKGYSLLICDDMVKNWEEATSPLINEAIWKEFQACALSGADHRWAVQLVIGTRWAKDDPIGRLLENEAGQWLELTMPAVAEEDFEIRHGNEILYSRAKGSVICPQKHSYDDWMQIKASIPDFLWQAQYQQKPVDAIGKVIRLDWIRDAYIEEAPKDLISVARGWDMAFSASENADYTVGVKIGIGRDKKYYILDMQRFRVDSEQLANKLASTILADGQNCRQYIEKNGRSQEFIRVLNRDARLYGHTLSGRRVDSSKLNRAMHFILKLAEGDLKIVKGQWNATMQGEMLSFTGNKDKRDDIVDATSICFNNLTLAGSAKGGRGRIAI